MKRYLTQILIFTIILMFLSLAYEYKLNSVGFFSLYQGPSFIDRGWPWSMLRCYDTVQDPYGESGCFIQYIYIFYNFLFWILPATMLVLLIQLIDCIKGKILKKKKRRK